MYSHLRPVAARRLTTQLSQSTRRITTSTYQNRTQISTKRVPVPVTPTCSQTLRIIHTSRTSLQQQKMDTTSSATTKADPASPAPSAPAAPTGSSTSSTSPAPGSTSPSASTSTTNPTPTSTTATATVTDAAPEEVTGTSRPTQFYPEPIDDSNPLSDPLSVESQRLANAGAPLPLPSPETATPISPENQPKTVTVNGQAVALDNLGPMVVHKDGTISRIANWHEMTEIERQNTLRILGKRNQLRLGNLREGKVNGEGM